MTKTNKRRNSTEDNSLTQDGEELSRADKYSSILSNTRSHSFRNGIDLATLHLQVPKKFPKSILKSIYIDEGMAASLRQHLETYLATHPLCVGGRKFDWEPVLHHLDHGIRTGKGWFTRRFDLGEVFAIEFMRPVPIPSPNRWEPEPRDSRKPVLKVFLSVPRLQMMVQGEEEYTFLGKNKNSLFFSEKPTTQTNVLDDVRFLRDCMLYFNGVVVSLLVEAGFPRDWASKLDLMCQPLFIEQMEFYVDVRFDRAAPAGEAKLMCERIEDILKAIDESKKKTAPGAKCFLPYRAHLNKHDFIHFYAKTESVYRLEVSKSLGKGTKARTDSVTPTYGAVLTLAGETMTSLEGIYKETGTSSSFFVPAPATS